MAVINCNSDTEYTLRSVVEELDALYAKVLELEYDKEELMKENEELREKLGEGYDD